LNADPVYSERPFLISDSIIQQWKREHNKPDRQVLAKLPFRNIVVLLPFPMNNIHTALSQMGPLNAFDLILYHAVPSGTPLVGSLAVPLVVRVAYQVGEGGRGEERPGDERRGRERRGEGGGRECKSGSSRNGGKWE
jgi:hypothetical protein